MRKYSYEEFVRVDDGFAEGKLDFYGEFSPLSVGEQKEFLKKYAEYHKKRFGADAAYTKAVERSEIETCKKRLNLPEKSNLKWTAYKRKMPEAFEGWQFYTERLTVKEGTLFLNDSYAWPVPCAKYEFTGERFEEFSFQVKISKQYYAPVYGGVLSTTTGRFVELRAGCKELIKLYFSPNGQFIYKDSTLNAYRYASNVIGKYKFDEWNDITIKRTDGGFILRFNGVEQEFKRDLCGIDNLFIGGGMQPVDFWAVKPESLKTDKRLIESFFVEKAEKNQEEIPIGEVELPFVLGTEKNKDYALVLRSKAICKKDKIYKLEVDALDPGGEVFVNGKRVAKKDDFQAFCVDLTNYVKQGENDLEVVVYPRAPESLFNWHKHNDYYNGWFCQGVILTECGAYSEAVLEVETEKVGEETQFTVAVKNARFEDLSAEDIEYKIFLCKKYPLSGEKSLLCESNLKGDKIKETFFKRVELWNTENPVLYEIFVEFYQNDKKIYSLSTQTGFRTIEQKNGELYLNNKKILLKGALTMQFLPPYENVPLNHICPDEEQIIEQILMIKSMNGNCLRLHQLGYGTSDRRFAEICDRLGVTLIWTTRLIDSAENMQWTKDWKQAEGYQKQILRVKNYPSIIIWEGSNEGHFVPKLIDRIYDNFVSTVKAVDQTRLICPVSHLYYSWGDEGEKCGYYTNDGRKDETGKAVNASFGWRDDLVVRSAHPYGILLGYGQPWQNMVTQCYHFQDDLMPAPDKAYLVSEFAIIGRQNPNTPEAKQFINKDSYELVDEFNALGFNFSDEEWELSQAFQALCTAVATKQLRRLGADGMLWCCLTGGANNASYLKPIIDFYGYKKLAYYQLKEAFKEVTAFNENPDVLFDSEYKIRPIVVGANKSKNYSINVEIYNENEGMVASKAFDKAVLNESNLRFEEWAPTLISGYYTIRYTVTET